MIYDLHSNTNFSDGLLDPTELIDSYVTMEVDTQAITDHDTIDTFDNKDTQKNQ